MKFLSSVFLIILISFLTACQSNSVKDTQEYNQWLSNTENGCKVIKEVNDMIIEVKLLPYSYLALKEYEQDKNLKFDSLVSAYKNSTTFLIGIKPKDGHQGDDVMYKNISTYKEYIERANELNFDLESKIKLKTSIGEFQPVLSSLENTYGLTKGRKVYLVFADSNAKNELQNEKHYDLVYTDNEFKLGILHFEFDYSSIKNNLPQIDLK